MKAIILAAGRGSRMGTATDFQPKCLTKLHGKSLLDWQISALKTVNIIDIGIVCGYQREYIPNTLKKFVNENWQQTNMVSSLVCAKEWLRKYECIISYSDIVYSSEIVNKLALTTQKDDITIAYDENWLQLWQKRYQDPRDDAETFVQKDGYLKEIGKPISDISSVNGQYMGLFKTSPTSWKVVEKHLSTLSQKEINSLDMTTLLSNLILNGIKIRTISNKKAWYEIDNINDLNVCQELPDVNI